MATWACHGALQYPPRLLVLRLPRTAPSAILERLASTLLSLTEGVCSSVVLSVAACLECWVSLRPVVAPRRRLAGF